MLSWLLACRAWCTAKLSTLQSTVAVNLMTAATLVMVLEWNIFAKMEVRIVIILTVEYKALFMHLQIYYSLFYEKYRFRHKSIDGIII